MQWPSAWHAAPEPQLVAVQAAPHVPCWQSWPLPQSPSAPHEPLAMQPPPVLHFSPARQLLDMPPHDGAHWPICRHTALVPQSPLLLHCGAELLQPRTAKTGSTRVSRLMRREFCNARADVLAKQIRADHPRRIWSADGPACPLELAGRFRLHAATCAGFC
jgi:hypothetical protein